MNKFFTCVGFGLWAFITMSVQAEERVGNAQAAKMKVTTCMGCHGIKGYRASFPEVYRVPMLGGQSKKYIEAALHAYKQGSRKHATMRSIAASLSDQDIADLAAYYSQQNQIVRDHRTK